jgi:steroid 5-alpha reductase family enzyme
LLKGPKQLALGVASPLFISGLILYVSGVPLLEQKMDARHGDDASYKKYKEETNLLIPRPRWQ